ncbi:MAG TPA: DUF962 domain-containing protein [Alphaproteobacteria bacterium]|nr:DUF962 domain-containing protein [Alphaproteobacteria bacterium]
MTEKQAPITSYAEFWPVYLGEHRLRQTRTLHVIGTLIGILCFIKAVVSLSLGWLFLALMIGYGFAWMAHIFVEKNRPATFIHPLWSLRGDFHMLALWLMGRLDAELLKHHITD